MLPYFSFLCFLLVACSAQALELEILADTNRDGVIDNRDLNDRAEWSWSRGAFALANLDDDDRDGVIDAQDSVVNGPQDEADLTPLLVRTSILRYAQPILCIQILEGGDRVHLFERVNGKYVLVRGKLSTVAPTIPLALEATGFADSTWAGFIRIRVELRSQDALIMSDEVVLRVAPWIMLPNTATTKLVHVATGAYANSGFLDGLTKATEQNGATLLPPFETSHWQEMWMQDTMEVGYTALPRRPPMQVILCAVRGFDAYPQSLLGPNVGLVEIGTRREQNDWPGGDSQIDWLGNLEVSPPTPRWPLGRIYYGLNVESGRHLQDPVVGFVEAQRVQAPFWIDTSWQCTKRCSEIINFIPDSNSRTRVLVASPRLGGVLYPDYYTVYNQNIQAKIDQMINGGTYLIGQQEVEYAGLLALLGLDASAVVELPVLYSGDGLSNWASPVSSVYLNGTLLIGNAVVWDPERQDIEARLKDIGVPVFWLDTLVYHENLSSMYAAVNTSRVPLYSEFVEHLPAGL